MVVGKGSTGLSVPAGEPAYARQRLARVLGVCQGKNRSRSAFFFYSSTFFHGARCTDVGNPVQTIGEVRCGAGKEAHQSTGMAKTAASVTGKRQNGARRRAPLQT